MTDRDPRLPIDLRPVSNGEYDPRSLAPVAREAVRRAREACLATADRLAMPRRRFLRTLCAASITLLALDSCTSEAHRAGRDVGSSPDPTSEPGGGYAIPPEAATEPEAAEEAVGGEEFVMDIQGHLLEYDLNPVFHGEGFYANFPQQYCGEDDPRVCFSIEHFLEAFFIRSDTNVVVLSALPIYPEGSPLGIVPRRACAAPRPGPAERRVAPVGARGHGGHRQPVSDRCLEDVHALPRLLRPGRRGVVARRSRGGAAGRR
jgi:hypothetical protein